MSENRFKFDKNVTFVKIRIGKKGQGSRSQWVEFDKRLHSTKDVTWSYVKDKFGYAYDRKLSKRLAKMHGTTKEKEFKRIRDYRRRGISFGELY